MRIQHGPVLLFGALLAAGAAWAGMPDGAPIRFGEPLQVSAPGDRSLAPDVAAGPNGDVHALWVVKAPPPEAGGHDSGPNHTAADQLYYRRLSQKGNGYVPVAGPVRVNQQAGEVWGFAVSKPELAVGKDGIVHVMFPANGTQQGTSKGILEARYTRSVDGGRSFAPSRTLNSPAGNDLSAVMHGGFAAAHAFGTLTAGPGGAVHVYWIDTRFMTEESTAGAMFAAVSRDGGDTFGTDYVINAEGICPCCQLAARAPDERVFVSSRQVSARGERDSAVAVSSNRGDTFKAPVRLGEGRWEIAGCPLKRTAIAVAGDHVYTVWYTGGQEPAGAWFARSADGGDSYEPSIALHPDAAVSDAPTVAALEDGTVFVAWHAKTGGPRRVFASISTDHGRTFSSPVEVPAPDGLTAYPELTAGEGGAHLAFQHEEAAWVLPLRPAPAPVAANR